VSELSNEEFDALNGKVAKIQIDGGHPQFGFCLDVEGVGLISINTGSYYDSIYLTFDLEPEISPEIKTRNEIAGSVRAESESEKPDCQEYKDSIMR